MSFKKYVSNNKISYFLSGLLTIGADNVVLIEVLANSPVDVMHTLKIASNFANGRFNNIFIIITAVVAPDLYPKFENYIL